MEFLLQPDIAYLILLGGILLTLMAIITPGTGFFEVGAFFCILFSGYAVYNLPFNWWAILLIVLSIVPFIYSIQKPKREGYLGASIFLLVLGSVFLYAVDGWKPAVNPFVALAASGLMAGFLWIAVRKTVQAASVPPSHNLDGLVGMLGEARTAISREGSVLVNGELWSAKSDAGISSGTVIRVVGREGFFLVVEATDKKINQ